MKTMQVKVIDYMNCTAEKTAYRTDTVEIIRNNAKTYTVRNSDGMIYKVKK